MTTVELKKISSQNDFRAVIDKITAVKSVILETDFYFNYFRSV